MAVPEGSREDWDVSSPQPTHKDPAKVSRLWEVDCLFSHSGRGRHPVRRDTHWSSLKKTPSRVYVTQLPKDQEKSLAMTSLLQEFIQQKVITPVPWEEEGLGCYSHVFLVKKPSGKVQVNSELKDLKQVNSIQKILYGHNLFSEESSSHRVLSSLHRSQDAYLHVPITPTSHDIYGWQSEQGEWYRTFSSGLSRLFFPLPHGSSRKSWRKHWHRLGWSWS